GHRLKLIVRFQPPAGDKPGSRNGTLEITTDDPSSPTVGVAATARIPRGPDSGQPEAGAQQAAQEIPTGATLPFTGYVISRILFAGFALIALGTGLERLARRRIR